MVRARFSLGMISMVCALLHPALAHAWFDETHAAVMRAADGPYCSCLAAAPDMLVDKLPTEGPNHYCNSGDVVTEAMVREQAARYNQADATGHVYGAVLAAYRRVQEVAAQHRRPAYAYGFLAHYLGDLSQPLHVIAHDSFNKTHHLEVDGVVNDRADLEKQIRARMAPITINNEADVVREIVRLANASRTIGERMRATNTLLSEDEALNQLGHAASLLHAITVHLGLID